MRELQAYEDMCIDDGYFSVCSFTFPFAFYRSNGGLQIPVLLRLGSGVYDIFVQEGSHNDFWRQCVHKESRWTDLDDSYRGFPWGC